MKNITRPLLIASALFLLPIATFAAANLQSALGTIGGLINTATPIVVALALLGFFWGLAIFIFNAGNQKEKAKGRNIMIWGILALFVMLSVFGIVSTLQSTLGLQNTPTITIPSVNTNGNGTVY